MRKGYISCEYANLCKTAESLPIFKRFEIKERIKYSNKRAVYRVMDKKYDRDSIVKVMIKRNMDEKNFSIFHFLKNNPHPNIYNIYEIGEAGGFYVILSEYIHGIMFSKFAKKTHDIEEYKYVLKGLLNGIEFLHKNNIEHVDIKPSNIIVNKELCPKIIDFDLAKLIHGEYVKDNVVMGTFPYIPREIFVKKKYYLKSDIWSLGVSAIKGLYYFDRDKDSVSLPTLTQSIRQISLDFPDGDGDGDPDFYLEYADFDFCIFEKKIGKHMCKVIKSMCNINVEDRPTATELLLEFQDVNLL
jgi:serine/threonine protein kinase